MLELVAPLLVLVAVLVGVLVAAVSSAGSEGLLQAVRAPGRKASAANAVLKFVVSFTVLVTFEVCLGRVLGHDSEPRTGPGASCR